MNGNTALGKWTTLLCACRSGTGREQLSNVNYVNYEERACYVWTACYILAHYKLEQQHWTYGKFFKQQKIMTSLSLNAGALNAWSYFQNSLCVLDVWGSVYLWQQHKVASVWNWTRPLAEQRSKQPTFNHWLLTNPEGMCVCVCSFHCCHLTKSPNLNKVSPWKSADTLSCRYPRSPDFLQAYI